MHPFKMTVDGLVQVLEENVLTSECRKRVQALGEKIKSEHGLENACQLINTYLDQQQTAGPASSDYAPYTLPLHTYSKIQETRIKKKEQVVSGIPKILHQTWKDTVVPASLIRFQQTWQVNHPGWAYLLWTDSDNRKFIQRHYPWFLRIYDTYPEHIMRVDAVRYFILYHYGGVYVDLDFECVKPIKPLLTGKQIVLGAEPDAHMNDHCPTVQPFPKLLCNAFMASSARHPFWEHLFKKLITYRRAPDPLNATGPFFLTRAVESYQLQDTINIVSDDLLYPVKDNGTQTESYLSPVERVRISQKAYGIHHWSCTWYQESRAARAEQVKVSVMVKGEKAETASLLHLEEYRLQMLKRPDVPMVSCLMAAHGLTDVIHRSIHCFQRQTYPRKELIVIAEEGDDILVQWIEQLKDENIVYRQVPSEFKSHEDLWAIAAAHAKGDYVASWQTNDLPDPRRLEVQMAAVHVFKTKACFLERQQFFWPEKQQLIFSARRIWENSLICKKLKPGSYAAKDQNKGADFFNHIVKNSRIALVDFPQLNMTMFSADMTESTEAWDEYAQEGTESFNNDVYNVMVQSIQNYLQLDLSPWIGPQPAAVVGQPGRTASLKQALEKRCDSIPKILHQTWKDTNIPPDLKDFQRTWQKHHPDWMYCLWTDIDIRELIRHNYAWFLPIYDLYPEHIMRVDAVRYFIMSHYGGVYIDLDFECLKPFDKLLTGKQIVLGLEPPAHLDLHLAKERDLSQIVCNAFVASVPGHPFWEHVFKQLIACHRAPGPLDATGPFLLTRAYESYVPKDTITIVSADRIYPTSSEEPLSDLKPAIQAEIAKGAYAIHHWRGTWWKEKDAKKAQHVKAVLFVQGQIVTDSPVRIDHLQTFFSQPAELPGISCLMVTQNRPLLAQRSIRCFQHQSYKNREMVIIDDGEDDTLEEWIKKLDDEQIIYVRLPAENRSLGELRNIAVEKATGTYVTQWDDDDLSDPERLQFQLSAIHLLQTDACFLERQQIWWPDKRRFALSCRRIWEGSFVCLKSFLPRYPDLSRGEDSPVAEHIVRCGRVALLDLPQLYTYIFHGANTFDSKHWEAHWTAATESYENDMYDSKITELQNRLQFDLME